MTRSLRSTASRFGAAILGGFVFTWGFVALGTLAGNAGGLTFEEAHTLANLLSLPIYLAALLWGFAARNTALAWLVLGGGGLLASAAAYALSRAAL